MFEIIKTIFSLFLYQPLLNILLFLYQALGFNMGWAIIAGTVLIRLLLIPLTLPAMRSAKVMQELKPKLEGLKQKHKDDKQALAQAQMQLYRDHGINPFASILPTILQIVVLIALFQAFNHVLLPGQNNVPELNSLLLPFVQLPADHEINTQFLYLDVAKPDVFPLANPIKIGPLEISTLPGVLLLLAAATQFYSSKLMMPKPDPNSQSKKNPESAEDMAASMQKQMLIMMPIITIVIGLSFPAGLVLYWLTFSVAMIVQQLFIQFKTDRSVSVAK